MTGTVNELCDYNVDETSNLNKFDLFSLRLFKKIKEDCLLHADSCKHSLILKTASPSISPDDDKR